MDPLSAIASVIAVYQLGSVITGCCFHYCRGVKSANRDSEMVMDQIDIFQKSLRSLKIMLEDESERKGNSNRLKALTEIMNPDAPLMKYITSDLKNMKVKLEEETHKEGVMVLLRKLKWPFKEEEVKKVLEGLKTLSSTIERAQSADTTQMVRNIDTNTTETKDTAKRIEQKIVVAESKRELDAEKHKIDEEKKEKESIKEKIRVWLQHPDPAKNHNIACKARSQITSTGQWFLDSDDFANLKETSGSLLWLHGDPGCGKTILSSAAIEELRVKPDIVLAYWYFSSGEKGRTLDDNCVRSLLTQIMNAMPNDIPGAILDFWTAKKNGAETPKTADLVTVLQRLLSEEHHKYFILLDALDEATREAQDVIFDLLQTLTLIKTADLHIFVTSRTYVKNALESKFKSMTTFYDVGIQKAMVDADIRIHIEEQLKSNASLKRWPEETKKKILESLLAKADGMFRWVECQLEAIRGCRRLKDVDKVLTLLPKDLHEQYTRDLANIAADDAEDALKLLKWLAFPLRKIRLEEAIDMLAVDMDGEYPVFDVRDRMIEPDLILEICGSLLRTDVDTNGRDHMGDVATVTTLTTSHATVLEFLSSEPIRVGDLEEIRLTKSSVALQMAEVCLGYLHSLYDLGIEMTEESLGQYPFARLCAEFWDDFYRTAMDGQDEGFSMERLNGMAIRLFDSKSELLMAVRLCSPNNDTDRVDLALTDEDLDSPIYYASLHGMPDIINHYIDQGDVIDYTIDRGYGTPLVAASALGREKVVSLLLEKGADPTLSGYWYWGTPLAAAVEQDRITIVKMLLAVERVDINSVRCTGKAVPISEADNEELAKPEDGAEAKSETTPLTYEQEVCRESMVYIAASYDAPLSLAFLLERNADPNMVGGLYCSALQAACIYGRQTIVEQLLGHGARADIYGGSMGSALIAACQGCTNVATLRLVIDAGCDVNYMGGDGFCAMYTAIRQGKQEFVELLLQNGANVNVRDCGPTENLLQAACYASQPEIVKLLIDAGMSPDIKGGSHVYPLLRAVHENETAVVKALLEKGADPNVSGGGEGFWADDYWIGSTPLEHASTLEMFTTLLDAGVSVDHQTKTISSGLARALVAGDEELVDFLLERGADISQYHPTQGTMLSCAVRSEKISLIDCLLEKGLEINLSRPDRPTSTILHVAAALESPAIVEYLFEKGAKTESTDWQWGSPLMVAIHFKNTDVIEVFMNRGLLCRGGTNMIGQDALLMAVKAGLVELVERLIESGFDPKEHDKRGASALHYASGDCNPAMIKALLQHGLDINSIDNNGATALHWAASSTGKSERTIHTLLTEKAIQSLKDNQGRTALDLAREYSKKLDAVLLSTEHAHTVVAFLDNEAGIESLNWYCDACGNCRWNRYKCQSCTNFDLCARCHLDQDSIHFPEHTFELIVPAEVHTEPAIPDESNLVISEPVVREMRYEGDYKTAPTHIGDVWTMYNEGEDGTFARLLGPSSSESLSTSGRHYFEMKILEIGDSSDIAVGIGIAKVTADIGGMVGWNKNTFGYHSDDGAFFGHQVGGSQQIEAYGPVYGQGDIIGCGWDFDDASMFFTRNGERFGTFVGIQDKTYAVITARFFNNKVPSIRVDVNFGDREFSWKDPNFVGI